MDQSQPKYRHRSATFGKTLRTISGRSSIGRMRHITEGDRQPSPNSSLFVNTSLNEDGEFKVLHHRSGAPTSNFNGVNSPIDRKRKSVHELVENRTKKMKTQASAYTSALEILKYPFSPKKPAQVSTPFNVKVEKPNIDFSKEGVTESQNKKWCILM